MHLSALDLALVMLYLAAVAAIGLWAGRGIRTRRDLFLAGRSLPWWAAGLSLVVSDIGAKDMVGLADDGYRFGLVMANFDLIGCGFPVLVAAFLFMPYLWMAGVFTVPEYLGLRYSQAVRTFFALIWALFMVGTLGVIFVSAASVFEGLLGWGFGVSVVATAVLVGLYTAVGGLRAVVFTDAVSCVVLVAGAALICAIGLREAGGWEGVRTAVAAVEGTGHHFHIVRPADDPDYAWPAVLLGLGFVLGPAYWVGNQAIVQRAFGVRSQAEARASYLLCAAVKTVFPFLLVVPGLIGLALFHERFGPPGAEGWKSGQVLPELVKLLPSGVLGVVVGAFLAGVMSNLDSYVNSAATVCVTDLYQPLVNPQASERACLWLGRGLVVVFLALGVGVSFWIRQGFGSVFEAFQTFLSFFQGPLLALLLLGMLTRRATAAGGLAGLVAGVGMAIALKALGAMAFGAPVHFLWVAWWSFVAAMAAAVAISLVTRPYDDERLRGLVWFLPKREGGAG
jgi:SSS family solute:Na+ symporter